MGRSLRLALTCGLLLLGAWGFYVWAAGRVATPAGVTASTPDVASVVAPDDRPPAPGLEKITLASGCFWCTESDFDALTGVVSTTSGYTGGRIANPTYGQVSAGGTGHVEAVEVVFDPAVVGLEAVLEHYWHNVDFLNAHGQFCDYGEQYRPVIFVRGEQQRQLAEASRARLQGTVDERVVVEILDARPFYPAEAYHQDFYTSNPVRYRYYRWSCGRDARLAELWRRPS
jgi:peptide-methionine (S)-S-oxide reductase